MTLSGSSDKSCVVHQSSDTTMLMIIVSVTIITSIRMMQVSGDVPHPNVSPSTRSGSDPGLPYKTTRQLLKRTEDILGRRRGTILECIRLRRRNIRKSPGHLYVDENPEDGTTECLRVYSTRYVQRGQVTFWCVSGPWSRQRAGIVHHPPLTDLRPPSFPPYLPTSRTC